MPSLWLAIRAGLNQYIGLVEDYPPPLPYAGQELGEGLYDSSRDYLEQVEAFKFFQGRLHAGVEDEMEGEM